MSPASASRRVIAAATFVACMLVAGPAAYAAGAATSDGDERSTSTVAGSGEGVTGAGSGGHDHASSADPTQDGGDSGNQDDGAQDGGAVDTAGQDPAGQDGGQDTGAQGGAGDADGAGGDDAAGRADGPDGAAAALDILAADCTGSLLQPHDGFQKAPRCVSTEFGEVAAADRSPSLLITDSPDEVAQSQGFSMTVSTRNLVRDRFLAAAQGGYYVESSLLDDQGLQRGHFHTACRMLPNPAEAPDSAPDPLFFEATEDGAGGSTPDEVTIAVPGIQQSGELQCSSWAGDGSHRTPMMQRANQTPAFDSVRIKVG